MEHTDIPQNMTSFEYSEHHRKIQTRYGNSKAEPAQPAPTGAMADAFGKIRRKDEKLTNIANCYI
ncbi:hypothetical protein HMY34_01945 [Thiothrix subterranea]|uniref:hypothetical protein n=1 Tax=Thiothrix subterranea TaxID=2735563 RepID=UPI00192CBD1C|nr:hypothetical protein [Thiothrix subterranea]QQZ27610.1 hypothetical protein HMY34_01945 [Thiothrix subterranea]